MEQKSELNIHKKEKSRDLYLWDVDNSNIFWTKCCKNA